MEQQIQLLEQLIPFIQFGFVAGLVIAVVVGAGRLGFRFAPYIIAAALIIYLFF
jgi:hypothetical protein